MSEASFQIDIRGGEAHGELMRFRPGETLQGSIVVTPTNDLEARHVNIRLLWYTEGRGDRDRAIITEQDVFQGKLAAGVPAYYSFHFALPQQPWSYAGHYVNIVWVVEAMIDLALAIDPRGQQPFVLAPDA
ncbi:MAG: hypothetical protein E4G99_01440 [Anaerolineales bacterium]|nr:MAG: hypothetical protein E4G99_01440 [Anaerolineales bacterium]